MWRNYPLWRWVLTCTCRGIPIAPSRRMFETLLLDEDSLLLTWSISTVLQVFNAVLCIFMGCFSSDFFPLHPTISTRSSAVFWTAGHFCFSGFSGQLIPWLCHSHWYCFFSSLSLRTCGPGLVVLLLVLFSLPWFWLSPVSRSRTVKSPNAVWGLNVVIGNTNISFGPAQFICKAMWFFQKQSLHDIIFCFGYLYCRFWLG
jgi:hypothetical protein